MPITVSTDVQCKAYAAFPAVLSYAILAPDKNLEPMEVLNLCKKYGMSNPTDIRHFLEELERVEYSNLINSPAIKLLQNIAYPRRGSIEESWSISDIANEATKVLEDLKCSISA